MFVAIKWRCFSSIWLLLHIARSFVFRTTSSRYYCRRESSKKICNASYLYDITIFAFSLLRDGMSFLFKLLPEYLLWLSAFIIPQLNNVQQFPCSRFVNKMVGGEEEELQVFLGLVIISTHSIFIAARFSYYCSLILSLQSIFLLLMTKKMCDCTMW